MGAVQATRICADLVIRFGPQPHAGLEKAAMLCKLCERSALLRPLCRLVKYWARQQNISGAAHSRLNSYGWTLLVVAYLQSVGELPPTEQLLEEEGSQVNDEANQVNNDEGNPGNNAVEEEEPVCAQFLRDQLIGFFKFCSEIQFGVSVISVRCVVLRCCVYVHVRCGYCVLVLGSLSALNPLLTYSTYTSSLSCSECFVSLEWMDGQVGEDLPLVEHAGGGAEEWVGCNGDRRPD